MSPFASKTPPWALEVGCPHCGVGPGEKCVRPSGYECYPHQGRLDAARRAQGEDPDRDQAGMGLDDARDGEDRRQIGLELGEAKEPPVDTPPPPAEDGTFEPISVWCPECEAVPGQRCMTHGKGMPRSTHSARQNAADHASRVGQDPAKAPCGHCGAEPHEPCETVGGNRRDSHHTRRGQ